MDFKKISEVQKKVLNLIQTEYDGELPFDEAILILGDLIPALVRSVQAPEPVKEAVVEILPEQQADILELAKQPPAIDRDDYTLAESMQHKAETSIREMEMPSERKARSGYKPKRKVVAVEEFDNIRRLEDDELF